MTSTKKVNAEPLTDEEIDHLLATLSSDEIEKLLEDVESHPDDTFLPPSARNEAAPQAAPAYKAILRVQWGQTVTGSSKRDCSARRSVAP